MLYSAVKSYKASNIDEITVAIGSVVEVLQKSDNGWWLIRYFTLQPQSIMWWRLHSFTRDKLVEAHLAIMCRTIFNW